jgi:hypothetical protein
MMRARLAAGVLLAAACGLAHAQAFKWVDKDGKTRYGDFPPAGVKATPMKAPSGPAAPAPSSAPAGKDATARDAAAKGDGKADAAKAAPKGPLTPAEQAQAFRERQMKAKEDAEKADKQRAEADARKQNCTASQEALRTLESGRRISSVNAQGESVFLDDAQIQQRIADTRKAAAENCK